MCALSTTRQLESWAAGTQEAIQPLRKVSGERSLAPSGKLTKSGLQSFALFSVTSAQSSKDFVVTESLETVAGCF